MTRIRNFISTALNNGYIIPLSEEDLDWFNSFTPVKYSNQVGCYGPTGDPDPAGQWKPSKEEIGALNYAYCELFKREDVGHNILGPLQKTYR